MPGCDARSCTASVLFSDTVGPTALKMFVLEGIIFAGFSADIETIPASSADSISLAACTQTTGSAFSPHPALLEVNKALRVSGFYLKCTSMAFDRAIRCGRPVNNVCAGGLSQFVRILLSVHDEQRVGCRSCQATAAPFPPRSSCCEANQSDLSFCLGP